MSSPAQRAIQARYNESEEGRARKNRYNHSQKNRVVQARWRGTVPAVLAAVRDVSKRRGTR